MYIKTLPDYEYLNKLFFYEHDTGKIFFRHSNLRTKNWNTYNSWKEAGRVNIHGYRVIGIDGKMYMAHRIAWKLFYEKEPTLIIDHVNRDGSDNRIGNLRMATPAQSSQNRSSYNIKLKGLTWVKSRQKYMVRIRINGKVKNLGRFSSEIEAHDAYRKAAIEHFGEFACLD